VSTRANFRHADEMLSAGVREGFQQIQSQKNLSEK
jgi:hypothetical protein